MMFNVGDRVLLRKPPDAVACERGPEGVPCRRLPLRSGTVHEIYKVDPPPRVVLCYVVTRNMRLQFAQPVATERLVGYSLADIETPFEFEAPLTLEVKKGLPTGSSEPR